MALLGKGERCTRFPDFDCYALPLDPCDGAFLSAVVYYGKEKPFTFHDVAVTIVGGIVFPAMYSCIFLLRMDENYGKLYVLAPFCVAFVGDALSMYFGMWFGKRKMAPHVSPHKTWQARSAGPSAARLRWCCSALSARHGSAMRRTTSC